MARRIAGTVPEKQYIFVVNTGNGPLLSEVSNKAQVKKPR
jgi:hypothetical protein